MRGIGPLGCSGPDCLSLIGPEFVLFNPRPEGWETLDSQERGRKPQKACPDVENSPGGRCDGELHETSPTRREQLALQPVLPVDDEFD